MAWLRTEPWLWQTNMVKVGEWPSNYPTNMYPMGIPDWNENTIFFAFKSSCSLVHVSKNSWDGEAMNESISNISNIYNYNQARRNRKEKNSPKNTRAGPGRHSVVSRAHWEQMLTRIRASPLTTTTRLSKLPPSLHAANCGGYLCTTDRWIRRATCELATTPNYTCLHIMLIQNKII